MSWSRQVGVRLTTKASHKALYCLNYPTHSFGIDLEYCTPWQVRSGWDNLFLVEQSGCRLVPVTYVTRSQETTIAGSYTCSARAALCRNILQSWTVIGVSFPLYCGLPTAPGAYHQTSVIVGVLVQQYLRCNGWWARVFKSLLATSVVVHEEACWCFRSIG